MPIWCEGQRVVAVLKQGGRWSSVENVAQGEGLVHFSASPLLLLLSIAAENMYLTLLVRTTLTGAQESDSQVFYRAGHSTFLEQITKIRGRQQLVTSGENQRFSRAVFSNLL